MSTRFSVLDGADRSGFKRMASAVKSKPVQRAKSITHQVLDALQPVRARDSARLISVSSLSVKVALHNEEGDPDSSEPKVEVLPINVALEDVAQLARDAFSFSRAAHVLHAGRTIGDEAAWRSILAQHGGGVALRRRNKVMELAELAQARFGAPDAAERIAALAEIFELLDQNSNLHGITEGLVDAIVDLVNPARQPSEVVSAAALVLWRLSEHKEFLVKLAQREAHTKLLHVCNIWLAESVAAEPTDDVVDGAAASTSTSGGSRGGGSHGGGGSRGGGCELPSLTGSGGNDAQGSASPPTQRSSLCRSLDSGGTTFACTGTTLGGIFNVTGPLRALAQTDAALQVVAKRVIALTQIAQCEGPETARLAAETLCYILSRKWKARETLVKQGGIYKLCDLLQSRAMHVSLCAAASLSLFVRDAAGRKLISAPEAMACFNGLVVLSSWTLNFITESGEDTAELQVRAADLLVRSMLRLISYSVHSLLSVANATMGELSLPNSLSRACSVLSVTMHDG